MPDTDTWKVGVRSIEPALAQSRTAAVPSGGDGFRLPAGCRIKGSLELEGEAIIEGEVEGQIHSQGSLLIAKTASIVAEVSGEQVRVYGKVRGNIRASVLLELHPEADVEGDLSSPRVVMKDGVAFSGNCEMGSLESA